jgi:cobalt-zinc-cadmium efflux system protein
LAINLQQPKRLLTLSLAVTAAIAVVEVVGGILSNSISLVSDAVHVFTDVMAIALSLFAITMAARSHAGAMTFGYHRAEVLAALANGVALSAISVWVLYEAVLRVMSPRLIDAPLMLTAAGIGLAGNLVVMFLLKHHAGKSINVQSAFVHVVYDAVSSVAVIITGLIAFATGITIVDPLVAFLIAGLVARSAYSIVRSSTHILLEGAPRQLDMQQIVATIKQLDGVVDVHDLHVWTISTGMDALSGHVVVRDQMLSQSSKLLDDINRALAERYNITHTTIQMENEREVSFKRTAKN